MRWLKHLSMAHEDPKMAKLMAAHGPLPYAIYWLIVELIAASLEATSNEPSLTHSAGKWAANLYVSPQKFCKVAEILRDHQLISFQEVDGCFKISVPKLLKYRDEYRRKSGYSPDTSPDTLPTSVGTKNRTEQNRTENTLPPPSFENSGQNRVERQPAAPEVRVPLKTENAKAKPNGVHVSEPDPELEAWAAAAYARHPKKAAKIEALTVLRETFRGHAELRKVFDKHHEWMVKTEEWRGKHGRFAPKLHEWVLNDGWRDPPDNLQETSAIHTKTRAELL